jgi:HSP20 family protein
MFFMEARHLADEVRRAFEELERAQAAECRAIPGECAPALDVCEDEARVEIRMDLPGVRPDSVRVLLKESTVLIVGEKMPRGCEAPDEGTFHLVERSFGRFARAVRVTGAFDSRRATATLAAGELQVIVPRIEERRGHHIVVPVTGRS